MSAAPARSTLVATVLVALSACAFGAITILVTLASRAGAPLLSTLALRYLIGSAALLLIAGIPALRMARGRIGRHLVLGGAGQAAIAFGSLLALRWIPAATLVFLFYTYPSWIAAIAAVRGTERVGPLRAAALLLSLLGIGVMVGAPAAASLHPVGVALALGSALVYALYVPFLGTLSDGIPARASAGLVTGGAGLVFVAVGLAASLLLGADAGELRLTFALAPGAWWPIAALAFFSTVLAFVFFLTGLPVLGPVRTAIVSTIEPFFAAALGALVLKQPLGWPTIVGGACIAAAIILLQLPQAAPAQSAA